MAAIITDNPIIRPQDRDTARDFSGDADKGEKLTQLGIWLSGMRSFLTAGPQLLHGAANDADFHDRSREFRIVHAGLRRCILFNSQVLSSVVGGSGAADLGGAELSADDLDEMSVMLDDAVHLSESLVNSSVLGPRQWRAWSDTLTRRFGDVAAFDALIGYAERMGANYLPVPLATLGADGRLLSPDQSELVLVLPKFGMVLKWLSIVKAMLDADEPLKSALLIFARVNELVADLTLYITNRLDRFPDQEAELFSTLDAAAYTASMELKKVYSQELAGIAAMRPTPSIFARVETAHALLNDGFQQILAGFARLVDPETDILSLFPEFRIKLDQSLVLRSDLWSAAQAVQTAEKEPSSGNIEKMRQTLINFREVSMRHLFYKDTETVERFIEEILVTNQNKDLVPILHRFGAFLDTLFGQVNLRAVLAEYPFDPDTE